MKSIHVALIAAAAALSLATAGYWFGRSGMPSASLFARAAAQATACPPGQAVLYYREPGGGADFSAEPKKDASGRDYLPVCEEEEVSFDPPARKPPPPTASGPRKILYYRNPMGLPDVSPVPKKDSMGMDYIPVYEGEDADDGSTVKVSLDKVQRSGVRSEAVEPRVIVSPVRGVGTVKYDERRLTVVSLRFEGFIEELFVNTTGQAVREGEPLFRVYSRDVQLAQVDLNVATGAQSRTPSLGAQSIEGTMQRLRNLGLPEARIQEVRARRTNPRTIDWPSPAGGTVIDKKVINGQRVMPGDELYRIADLSHMWVIAEVAESDLAAITVGMDAVVTLRAYPQQPVEGKVTFIYPDLRPETRTGRVRIELPNPDGRLKTDMYADVVFRAGAGAGPVIAVPASAVIDSGTRQVVLIAKGGGRFEPRAIKLGARGDGYVEVTEGVKEGESVVTAATFLIDSESNLNAALRSFTQQEPAP